MQGKSFYPTKLQDITGVIVTNANNPGDNGRTGKYRDVPVPYGAGEWFMTNNSETPYGQTFTQLVRLIEMHFPSIKKCGADELVIYMNIYYDKQCNLEFSPHELGKLSALGVTLAITCDIDTLASSD